MSAETGPKTEIQKWEYLFLGINVGNEYQLKVCSINGNDQKDWIKGISVYDYSNKLGEDGWEMVETSINEHNHPAFHGGGLLLLIFKRPKV